MSIASDVISYLSGELLVCQGDRFDYVVLGYHLNRFEPLPLAPVSRTVLLRIDRTGRLARDQLAQLLLDSLVLQSQLLTLIAHGAPLGDILVLHANDGLKAVFLLSFSLALKLINFLITCLAAELVRKDVTIAGCLKLRIQTLVRRVISQ